MDYALLLAAMGVSGVSAMVAIGAVPRAAGQRSGAPVTVAIVSGLIVPGMLGALLVRGKLTAELHGGIKLELSTIELVLEQRPPPQVCPRMRR